MARRVTEEERKMAFEGVVPPGRTEVWRKYFVWKQGWKAKKKAEKDAETAKAADSAFDGQPAEQPKEA